MTRSALYLDRRMVRLDARDIGFIQFPEFFLNRSLKIRDKTTVLAGQWDQVLTRKLYWSGKYEWSAGDDTGMVPLTEYVFYQSALQHFHDGVAWDQTPWFDWMLTRRPSRYETQQAMQDRLDLLDQLFKDATSGALRPFDGDPPRINIGRDGRISLDDGRHRMIVAILAGAKDVSASVSFVHPKAAGPLAAHVLSEPATSLPPLRRLWRRIYRNKIN